MARRRGNHEGSLYFHKSRGRWCAQVSIDGKRLTKYSRTQKECRDWMKGMLAKIESGLTFDGTRITVGDFIDTWLEGKELSRRSKTVLQYRQIAKQHIVPILGQLRLQDVSPSHIKQLYAMKREEGRGARTIQLIHAVLHNVLKQAVRERILGHNPMDAVERPKVEQPEMRVWDEEQIRQFLISAYGSVFEAAYYLALSTGMREGELLGLKWSDVDWNKATLFVQRQLQYIKGQGYVFVPPKTKAGKRKIKVGSSTLKYLEAHRSQQAIQKTLAEGRWQENNLIFPTTIGTPLDCRRLTKEFRRPLKRAGLPPICFHHLPHSSLNTLMDNEVPVNTVQRRAGHAKPSTTVNIYGHSTARSHDAAAEKIEELITPIAVKLQSK